MSLRLTGHAQRAAVEFDFDRRAWREVAKCECGATGGFVDTRDESREWHRRHKERVLADPAVAGSGGTP